MTKRLLLLLVGLLLVGLALTACSGGSNQTAATVSPPTRTPFPTFAYVEPTKPPVFDETSAEASTEADSAVALDPTMVARGLGRYEALECANCHGENGEGSDQAPSLLSFSLSEDDFVTFMRSGGELGPRHQYSTDRLSNSGSRNLYQYLVSLAQGE